MGVMRVWFAIRDCLNTCMREEIKWQPVQQQGWERPTRRGLTRTTLYWCIVCDVLKEINMMENQMIWGKWLEVKLLWCTSCTRPSRNSSKYLSAIKLMNVIRSAVWLHESKVLRIHEWFLHLYWLPRQPKSRGKYKI